MKAADVMVRNVGPDACVQDVAHVLLTARPIVDGGKVVGIVSRANLLQALASLSKRAESQLGSMTRKSGIRCSRSSTQSRGHDPR